MMGSENLLTTEMKLLSININGVKDKLEELKLAILENNPDVVIVQETRTRYSIKIQGYRVSSIEPCTVNQAQGQQILTKEELNVTPMTTTPGLNTINSNAATINVNLENKQSIRITALYNNPKNRLDAALIKEETTKADKTVIVGDLNAKFAHPLHKARNENGKILDLLVGDGDCYLHTPDT